MTKIYIIAMIGLNLFLHVLAPANILQDEGSASELTVGTTRAGDNFAPQSFINEEITEARVTCYAWTGNRMANGKYPVEGYVATSDRSIPFGTKIEIDGITYEVGDRTNKRIHNEFGILTVDIFREDCDLSFGANIKKVKIK